MMQLGFSSLVCPGWHLETMLSRAAEWGFDGLELRGLAGELHLPLVPELAARPDETRRRFEEKTVRLVCLASSATLDALQTRELSRQKASITEFIELAARLSCPFVRIHAGYVQRWDHRRKALGRIAEALSSLVPLLARHRVTLLVENGGDFPDSEAMWFLGDAVNHPAVKICWNQVLARTAGERPTNSIPRLGRKIGLVHVCDATFDDAGVLESYRLPGEGQAEVARQVELLRGVVYDGFLIFEWPKLWVETLPAADAVLPKVAQFLRERLAATQAVLSAYKGDKNAPRMARPHRIGEDRPVAAS